MVPPSESIAFDRIAERYDQTRGGRGRAEPFAAGIAPQLPAPPARVLELGVGTGAVAEVLAESGHLIAGVDLSAPMLAQALGRLPGRVAQCDAVRLAVRDASLDCVYAVWVLHLVADLGSVLGEVARVLALGGRFLALGSDPLEAGCDVQEVLGRLQLALRVGAPKGDDPALVQAAADRAGLALLEQVTVSWPASSAAPAHAVNMLRERVNSWLWDLEPARWHSIVEPAIAELQALPDQERAREVRLRYPLQVFAVAG